MDDVLATLPPRRKLGPGRYGAAGPQAGIMLRRINRASATLVSPAAGIAAVVARARETFGIALPTAPRSVAGQGCEFIGLGPGRWLALAEDDGLVARLEAAFAPAAAVIDQSGGLVVFDATGSRIRDMMAKLLAIDIEPAAFPPGSAATTLIAHIGVTVWLDGPCWRFAVGCSYEAAFLRAIASAATEYGIEFVGLKPPVGGAGRQDWRG